MQTFLSLSFFCLCFVLFLFGMGVGWRLSFIFTKGRLSNAESIFIFQRLFQNIFNSLTITFSSFDFFSFKYSSYKKHILKIEEKSQIQWKEDFFLTYNRSLFFLSIFTFCFFNANHDLHFCRNPLLSCETANLKHRRLSNSDTAV